MTHHARTIALDLLPSGEPPTEFRLFAMGDNETSKGTFVLDEEGAAAAMAAFEKHGMDRLPIDYAHGMVGPKLMPESGISAGWFVPELRADGIWATDVQWTERASTMLRAREYRFLSPAFAGQGKRIVEIINVALTNLPATQDALPLVASRYHTAGEASQDENIIMSDHLLKVLGAKDEGEAIVIASEWNKTAAELLAKTGATTLDAAMAAVAANAALPAEVVKLSAKLAAMEGAQVARDRDELIATLSRDGKLPPALHDWAKTQTVDSLSAFGAGAIAVSATATAGQPADGIVVLSEETEKIIAATGADRDAFIAERKRELSAKKGS